MRRIGTFIAAILCVGAVLALAGEAWADGRYHHSDRSRYSGRSHHSSRGHHARPSRSNISWGLNFGGLSFHSPAYHGRTYSRGHYSRPSHAYSGWASSSGRSGWSTHQGRSVWHSAPRVYASQPHATYHRYTPSYRYVPSRYYRGSAGFATSIGPVRVLVMPSRSYSSSRYGYGRSYSYYRGCR